MAIHQNQILNSYNFKTRYRYFVRQAGSMAAAKKTALDWFENEKKIVNLSMNMRKFPKRMEAGKIYIFNYNPKLKSELSFYDRNPIVLSLGPSRRYKNLDLGINLNFLPQKYKIALLNKVFQSKKSKIQRSFKKNRKIAKKGKTPNPIDEYPLKFWYSVAKRLIPEELSFAIRSYYPSRRSNSVVVSYNSWVEVSFLDIKDMEGITFGQLLALYRKHRNK